MHSATRLHAELQCDVVGPDDAAYDAARTLYFSALQRRPAAIARPVDAAGVARVIAYARAHDLPLAVRGGGHSPAGFGTCDDGIVLDLSALATLDIDPGSRIARAGGGLTAGEYTAAAAEYGLATGFGDAPSVGLGGITLAGGIGFLHRKYGLTADNLLAAELVTANGEQRYVDTLADPELFWGLRGGGGNFGVVTRLHLRLHPVDTVLGGMFIVPATPERLVAFFDTAVHAPDALSMIFAAMPAPPMPFIPPAAHGSLIIVATLVYDGPAPEGEAAIAPLRAGALADMVQPMRYPAIYDGHANAPHPPAVAIHPTFLDSLDVTSAAQLLDRLREGTAPMRVAQFRPLGGQVRRVPADATAFAHRDRACLLNLVAALRDPSERAEQQAWVTHLAAALPERIAGAYTAFLGAEGPARIHEAYPEDTWQRLVRLKRQYDPDNVFRGNHNIPP